MCHRLNGIPSYRLWLLSFAYNYSAAITHAKCSIWWLTWTESTTVTNLPQVLMHNNSSSSSNSSTAASLSPVSPPGNIFALPAEVFSSYLAIVSAVMVGGLFLWPALRYGTGYQIIWEIRPSAETPSSVYWTRFYFQLTRVHSALELFGRCALQINLLTYLLSSSRVRFNMPPNTL